MPRIVYLSDFPKSLITGGIKVMFRHVEMLEAMGFEATIFSSYGHPEWMSSKAKVLPSKYLGISEKDILVFPEVLNGSLGGLARSRIRGTKVLLCQGQYNVFSETISNYTFADLGFVKLITVGELPKRFLERVLAPAKFDVVPVWVDENIFYPREKSMRIAVFPRKQPNEYRLIRTIFCLKYPQMKSVPWDVIVAKPETETAEILGRATVFLSMAYLETVGLTPLEAMASGCVVVGFHGYGGLEYATDANGIWLRPDYLEETADALAQAVIGVEQNDRRFQDMRAAGLATAQRFNRASTGAALQRTFSELCA